MAASTIVVGQAEAAGGTAGRLSGAQLAKIVVFGLAFWFAAAMAVRFGTEAGFFDGLARVTMFGLVVPLSWATVWLAKWIASLRSAQVVPAIAMGTAAAAVCDGIALSWFPMLYGAGPDQALPGAAWILWGVGWILGVAYFDSARGGN